MKNITDSIKTISSEIIQRSKRNAGFIVISSSSSKAARKRLGNLKKYAAEFRIFGVEIHTSGVIYYLDKRVILM